MKRLVFKTVTEPIKSSIELSNKILCVTQSEISIDIEKIKKELESSKKSQKPCCDSKDQ